MAVYTKINQKEINIINKNFNIDKITSFKGIKQGRKRHWIMRNFSSRKFFKFSLNLQLF